MDDKKYIFEKIKITIKALGSFKKGLIKKPGDLERDGAIQRFEYSFELCWKLLKIVLEHEGINGFASPRSVFQQAFKAGLIDNEKEWLQMLIDRNNTSHIYDEKVAEEIFASLKQHFDLMQKMIKLLQAKFPN